MLHVVITLATAIAANDTYDNGRSSRVAAYGSEISRRAGYGSARQQELYHGSFAWRGQGLRP